MKHFQALSVGIMLWAPLALAAENPSGLTAEQQEVVKVSETIMDAFNRRDFKTVSHFAAAELIATGGDGGTYDRPASLTEAPGVFSTQPDSDQYRDRRDLHIRVHGDVAVLNFLVTEIEKHGVAVQTTHVRVNETYQKRDRIWLLLATSITEKQPVNQRKAVHVDPKKFVELVGQYQWAPDYIDTLTIEGDRLMQQLTGGKKDEILFADENTQFQRSDLGWVSMTRDEHGKINGYTYHRYDGQEFWVPKIK